MASSIITEKSKDALKTASLNKQLLKPGVVACALNNSTREAETDLCVFKAYLVCILNSRLARDI